VAFMAVSANAQSISDILGKVGQAIGKNNTSTTTTGTTSGSSTLGGITDIISSALGVTTTSIVGTWEYQEPAVLFTSDNLLAKAGGSVMSSSIEKKLDTYFQKVGVKKGMLTMTFDEQGNFTQSVKGKTIKGTYTVENGNVTLKYLNTAKQFIGTTQLSGNDLVIVVDATKILSFAQTVASSSSNSTLSSISSLTKNIKGMKAGLKLKKQ
ncbi:MAG: DUF4923 family protein, partial [Bacteroidaceae bacterium]|nr:DUF4923 family protein [Bacteroidaceae bacterium]